MNILVTICARKGSKRLPGKNIKIFHGKPLYEWTYNLIKELNRKRKNLDNIELCICTDIEEIYNKYQINCIARPKELSTDNIPKMETLKYILNEKGKYKNYDCVLDLDVTSPLRDINDVLETIDQYRKEAPPVLFSVVRSRRRPNFNQVCDYEGIILKASNIDTDYFDMNAAIYIYRPDFLLANNHPVTSDASIYIMEDWKGFDIDTQDDFDIVEFLFKKHYSHLINESNKNEE